ncbi:MAG: recombination protein RecR [Candidatus Zambryskibacteria bacterium CG10_big_fil_rev_8_21_14_0_10_42_12]|uniref:Recombination protein RecR n=1 Tax=Candidatus Zambryskibacteria bacterium CG10_big_fil_rev_8_21_14_0_10_42_12 TaxID=1975115 RepID=A0A2H0QX58_9BACT|nr:MAG: recombination protein RecR [Candidatus Zambryskibacteria bacterium CG10_big_fil_rev_8_21_14_0_10_42_12]
MNDLDRLKELFSEFPGIGPRQAERFVYFILRKNGAYAENLSKAILGLKRHIRQCEDSYQYFFAQGDERLSPIARSQARDDSLLMIVEKDTDLENIERSASYSGRYFVLGGTVPILEKEPERRIRIRELKEIIKRKSTEKNIKEIILALSANPDGEHTATYIKEELEPVSKEYNIKITELGRGLSTGTELEYSDKETIRNALQYRHS